MATRQKTISQLVREGNRFFIYTVVFCLLIYIFGALICTSEAVFPPYLFCWFTSIVLGFVSLEYFASIIKQFNEQAFVKSTEHAQKGYHDPRFSATMDVAIDIVEQLETINLLHKLDATPDKCFMKLCRKAKVGG